MIYGIGTDIFEVKRIKKTIEKQPTFIDGVFTENEIKYCKSFRNSAEHFAARYAGKEAFLKAIGTGLRDGISLLDIEITNNELGKPCVSLTGKSKELVNRLGITEIHISMSHTKTLASAFIIINTITKN